MRCMMSLSCLVVFKFRHDVELNNNNKNKKLVV